MIYENKVRLLDAISQNDVEQIKFVLNNISQQDIDNKFFYGSIALHVAVDKGHLQMVELLLNKMSQQAIDSKCRNKQTALHIAAKKGHQQIVELLLNKMSQHAIEANNSNQNTALSIAIKSGHENIAILIRDYGWKSIQNIVKNCKSLLLYLPKNLTKIVYDYLVESKDKSGDLIDETNSTYSDNKFIKTLEIAFEKHPTTTISPYISFGDKDLFLQNINS